MVYFSTVYFPLCFRTIERGSTNRRQGEGEMINGGKVCGVLVLIDVIGDHRLGFLPFLPVILRDYARMIVRSARTLSLLFFSSTGVSLLVGLKRFG